MIVIIIIAIIVFIIYKTNSNSNVPTYKHNSTYINLVNEDKLQIDLTVCLETLVASSLKFTKEHGYTLDMTNKYLINDIESFRKESLLNAYEIASKYKIPVNTAVSIINTSCQGAIGVYVF